MLAILFLALPASAKDELDEPPYVVERLGQPDGREIFNTPISFSPDGKLLAWGNFDGQIHLHDLDHGTEVRTIHAHALAVTALQYSQDGAWIASGGADGVARVWEAAGGAPVAMMNVQGQAVTSVRLSPDRSTLQTWNGSCVLWDVSTQRPQGADAPAAGEPVISLLPHGSPGGCVHLWDVATGRPYWCEWDDRNWTNAWGVSPDGVLLARADEGGRIYVWETASGGLAANLDGLPPDLVDLAFAPGGRTLAVVERTGVVHAIDLATGKVLWHSDPEKAAVVAFSPDGQRLAAGRVDGTVVVWRAGLLVPHRADVVETTKAALEAAWADVRGGDALHAWQAIWTLAAAGDDAVRFLRGQLPVPKASEDEVRRLIAELDADEYEARERAQRGLEGLGPQARPLLEKILAGTPTAEQRTRIELLLANADAQHLGREDLVGCRAVAAIERVGTSAARAFLAELAKGSPESRLTLDAKAASARLSLRDATRARVPRAR